MIRNTRYCFRQQGAAADCSDVQSEPEFERDLIGIGGKDGKRSRAHVTETDHTNVNVSHVFKEL